MFKYLMLAPAAVLVVACGDKGDDKKEDKGLAVPASFVTEAELVPGAMKAYDAAKIKELLEGEGRSFTHNDPDEADDEEESCFDTEMAKLLSKAEGDTIVFEGTIDYAACLLADYKKQEGWENADYSGFTLTSTFQLGFYIKCEGVDMTPYAGKSLDALETMEECNTATVVKTRSETSMMTKYSGVIKDVDSDGTKFNMQMDYESKDVSVSRGKDGGVCVATLDGAVFTWTDGCEDISRSETVKDSSGIEGEEQTPGDDVGKAEYEKRVKTGLKQQADKTSLWYVGGQYDVTYNDWSGTVKYSSATAEPIFELVKGSETVTGTVKAPTDK